MATRLMTRACTCAAAQRFVAAVHRHHGPIPGGYAQWSIAAAEALTGRVVAVAIMGRPTNRNSDDGLTIEVLRLASDGYPNACSALYGACARVSLAAGYETIITYTLTSESGGSLRGAGWDRVKDGILSWWTHPGGASTGRVVHPRDHYNTRR